MDAIPQDRAIWREANDFGRLKNVVNTVIPIPYHTYIGAVKHYYRDISTVRRIVAILKGGEFETFKEEAGDWLLFLV